jgi:IPT/TIG domain
MGFKYRRLLLGSACVLLLSSAIAGTGVITAHAAALTVANVSPPSGTTEGGDNVTITGSGFTTNGTVTSIQFGSIVVKSTSACTTPPPSSVGCFTVTNDTTIAATTPPHAQATVAVSVTTTGAGTSPNNPPGDQFTYTAPTPQAAVLDVHAGPGGTTINISPLNGTPELSGYDFATSVNFGSSGSNFMVTNTPCAGSTGPNGCFDIQSDLIRVEAPSTGWVAGTPYDVRVTTAGGKTSPVNTATDQFTFTAGNVYHPNNPFRLFDTRSNGQHLTAGRTDFVQVVGVDNVPGNATAAVVNVTATGGTASSFFTVFPGGNPRPLASNLNFVAHQTVANLVTVPIGSGGVDVFNLAGTADAVVDLEGYFAPTVSGPAGTYTPLPPARITDTRAGSGQPNAGHRLGANSTLFVPVNGHGGVPATGVSSVVLNVTAVGPSGSSFLTVFPHGTPLPLASNLNFTPGKVVPNRVIVPVASGGVDIYNQQGSVDVVVDTGGWFSDGSGVTGFTFTPLVNPTRIADTRHNSGLPLAGQTLGARDTRTVLVTTPLNLPGGTQAVAANVTVTNTSGPSFLTVFPTGAAQPLASDLNWVRGQTVPNLAITQLGSGGDLQVYNNTFSVDVIVDVFGYWS